MFHPYMLLRPHLLKTQRLFRAGNYAVPTTIAFLIIHLHCILHADGGEADFHKEKVACEMETHEPDYMKLYG